MRKPTSRRSFEESATSRRAPAQSLKSSSESRLEDHDKCSSTIFAPSMPDIFIWAPEEDAAALNIGPYCAFSSSSELQCGDETSLSDATEFEEEEEEMEEEELSSIHPRRSSSDGSTGEVSDEQVIAWTREILHTSPPPSQPPPTAKSFLARATSFIRFFAFGSKEKTNRGDKRCQDSQIPLTRSTRTRSGTVTRGLPPSNYADLAYSEPGFSTIKDKSSKRVSLFSLTQRNRSVTVLSSSSFHPAADSSPSSHSIVSTSVSDPCTAMSRPIARPLLRRMGTSPASLRISEDSMETNPHDAETRVDSDSEDDEQEVDYISHNTPSSNSPISPTDAESSVLHTPIDEQPTIYHPKSEMRKIPSLSHFDTLSRTTSPF